MLWYHIDEIIGCIDDMEELVDSMFGDAKVVFKGGEGIGTSISRLSSSKYLGYYVLGS